LLVRASLGSVPEALLEALPESIPLLGRLAGSLGSALGVESTPDGVALESSAEPVADGAGISPGSEALALPLMMGEGFVVPIRVVTGCGTSDPDFEWCGAPASEW